MSGPRNDSRYENIKIIGRGSQGTITIVKRNHKKYVIKRISLGLLKPGEQEQACQEAQILKKLNHPNIVEYVETFTSEGDYGDLDKDLNIVMTYCEGGDLAAHIKAQEARGQGYTEQQILDWFFQMADAVRYVHSMKILHRDLKSNNIFLTDKNIVKVGDFGIARALDANVDQAMTVVGTPYYMSPEICENKPYDYKSDVWALGCILYELCTFRYAFKADNLLRIVLKIVQEPYEPIPKNYSSNLEDLVDQMLQKDPTNRPNVDEILNSSFIQNHLKSCLENPNMVTIGKEIQRHSSMQFKLKRKPSGLDEQRQQQNNNNDRRKSNPFRAMKKKKEEKQSDNNYHQLGREISSGSSSIGASSISDSKRVQSPLNRNTSKNDRIDDWNEVEMNNNVNNMYIAEKKIHQRQQQRRPQTADNNPLQRSMMYEDDAKKEKMKKKLKSVGDLSHEAKHDRDSYDRRRSVDTVNSDEVGVYQENDDLFDGAKLNYDSNEDSLDGDSKLLDSRHMISPKMTRSHRNRTSTHDTDGSGDLFRNTPEFTYPSEQLNISNPDNRPIKSSGRYKLPSVDSEDIDNYCLHEPLESDQEDVDNDFKKNSNNNNNNNNNKININININNSIDDDRPITGSGSYQWKELLDQYGGDYNEDEEYYSDDFEDFDESSGTYGQDQEFIIKTPRESEDRKNENGRDINSILENMEINIRGNTSRTSRRRMSSYSSTNDSKEDSILSSVASSSSSSSSKQKSNNNNNNLHRLIKKTKQQMEKEIITDLGNELYTELYKFLKGYNYIIINKKKNNTSLSSKAEKEISDQFIHIMGDDFTDKEIKKYRLMLEDIITSEN